MLISMFRKKCPTCKCINIIETPCFDGDEFCCEHCDSISFIEIRSEGIPFLREPTYEEGWEIISKNPQNYI